MRYRYSDWMKPENDFNSGNSKKKSIPAMTEKDLKNGVRLGFVKTPIEKIWTLEK